MKMNWILLAFIALACLSTMSFLITFLTRKGNPTSFVLLGIGIMFVIIFSLQTFVFAEVKPEIHLSTVLLILLIGVLSVAGNFFLFQAAKFAPNPGLATAIGSGMQAGIVALLGFIFLKDKISTMQFAGLLLALVAIFLIIFGREPSVKKSEVKEIIEIKSSI